MSGKSILRGKSQFLTGLIFLICLVAVLDQRFRTGVTFMAILVLVVVAVVNAPGQEGQKAWSDRNNGKNDAQTLNSKEKKYLIFYILNQLKKAETIEMSEIATELNVSIYELTDIIKILNKHEVIEVIYPPMHDFPIIRKGDPEKSRAYMMSIYDELSKKSLMGTGMMEEFTREVNEYIQNLRR